MDDGIVGRSEKTDCLSDRFKSRPLFRKALAYILALEICQASFQQLAIALNILVVSSQLSMVFLKHLALQQTIENGWKNWREMREHSCRVKQKCGHCLM
jgi:hypothetical protein